jgi:DNA invertase Pin-like site-specific DNA recombinase/transposase
MQFLLQDLSSIDVVVVTQVDRISRDIGDGLSFHKMCRSENVSFVTVADGLLDEANLIIRLLIAQGFLDVHSRVQKEARAIRAAQGGFLHSGQYGYFHTEGLRKGTRTGWGIVEAEAAEIRLMYERRARGWKITEIAHDLAKRGIKRRNGKRISASLVRSILRSTTYKGLLTQGKAEKYRDYLTGKRKTRRRPQALWRYVTQPDAQIVSEELWDRVQETFKPPSKKRLETYARRIFQDVMCCGVCGEPMGIHHTAKKGVTKIRYECTNHRTHRGCSNKRTPNASEIEDEVLRLLHRTASNTEYLRIVTDEYNDGRMEEMDNVINEVKELELSIRRAQQQLERIADLTEDENFDRVSLGKKSKTLIDEKQAEEARLDILRSLPAALIIDFEYVGQCSHTLSRVIQQAHTLVDDTTDTDGLVLLRRLVKEIKIYPLQDRGRWELEVVGRLAGITSGENYSYLDSEEPIFSFRLQPTPLNGRKRYWKGTSPQVTPELQLFISGEADLTDAEWAAIEPIILKFTKFRDVSGQRTLVNALICHVITGVSIQRLPQRYGNPQSVYNFIFYRRRQGAVGAILKALSTVNAQLAERLKVLDNGDLYRPQFLRHQIGAYGARAADGSWFCGTAFGV